MCLRQTTVKYNPLNDQSNSFRLIFVSKDPHFKTHYFNYGLIEIIEEISMCGMRNKILFEVNAGTFQKESHLKSNQMHILEHHYILTE